MNKIKRILCFIMAIAMVTVIMPINAEAATKVKLNKKKVTLTITNKKKNPKTTLKVKGLSKKKAKKAKWTTSNKAVATVKKGKVTAKSAGKSTVRCWVGKKGYTCKITVLDKRTKKQDTKKPDNNALNIEITKASEIGDTIIPAPAGPYGGEDRIPATNRIKVTYNGKDVTNEAKYESSNPKVGFVKTPGILESGGYGFKFDLTVSYNGVSRTFTLGTEVIKDCYNECNPPLKNGVVVRECHAIFYDDDNGDKIIGHHNETNFKCMAFLIVHYVRYVNFYVVK